MKAHPYVLSKTLYSLLSTCSILVDRKLRVMAAKMLAATENINTNKQINSKQQNRHSSLIFAVVVYVYWYSCLPLVCYMKIFALKMLSMKMFIQILFVWQENDWCLALNLKKCIKNNNIKIAPCPTYTHTHTHAHSKILHA